MFYETAAKALYPEGHPYSWSTIGSMEDLSAATREDVEGFFKRYYVPNNAVVVVAGDVQADSVHALVERYFAWIPAGAPVAKPQIPVPAIPATRYITLEDRVSLPQVNLIWRTDKAYSADDPALTVLAAILTDGKNSRLYKRMVYSEQVAQTVGAFNDSQLLSGDFYLRITGKEGMELDRLQREALEEIAKIAAAPPTDEELQRVKAAIETGVIGGLEDVLGKAEQLNHYLYYTGDPDHVAEDLAAYRALTPADIQRAAQRYLQGKNRIVISIVPTGRTDLAAKEAKP
jgi:zinc protease